MKKIILLLFVFSYFNGYSQFEFGVKTGLSSLELATSKIILDDDNNSFALNFDDARYGFHFGLYGRVKLLGVYVEPSALINSSSVDYNFQDLSESGALSIIKSETFTRLDIPVLIGFKFLLFRVQAGPVAHIVLDSGSDLFDIDGYEQRFDAATYGLQAGVGVDLWKLRFDVLFEGNFSKFGDHLTLSGKEFSFDDRPSRLIANVSYKF